jgi:hypothetical protein
MEQVEVICPKCGSAEHLEVHTPVTRSLPGPVPTIRLEQQRYPIHIEATNEAEGIRLLVTPNTSMRCNKCKRGYEPASKFGILADEEFSVNEHLLTGLSR